MGYVDADCHGLETGRHTWEYFDPSERHYGPPAQGPWVFENSVITVDAPLVGAASLADPELKARLEKYYPEGTNNLSNIPARLKVMDMMGVDVQICFSNFWLLDPVEDPAREAALARSWNRFAAEWTAPSNGRIRWMAHPPARTMERAFQEAEFAAKNGAAGLEISGYKYEIAPGNPFWHPLYERAQDLDLCIAFHLGGPGTLFKRAPEDYYYRTFSRVQGAFHSLLMFDIARKFPKLKFAFVETSAAWVPVALAAMFRTRNGSPSIREFGDWRKRGADYLANANMYVTALMDEDMGYTVNYTGHDRMMIGTDYSHMDVGSDPEGLRHTMERTDVPKATLTKIVDDNPRRCYGVAKDFRPSDANRNMNERVTAGASR